jgi:hypothetical protein
MNVVSIEQFQFSKKELKQTVLLAAMRRCQLGLCGCSCGIYPCSRLCLPKPGHTHFIATVCKDNLVESDRNRLALRRELLSVALLGLAHKSYWTGVGLDAYEQL